MKVTTQKEINSFTRTVWKYYKDHGRHDLAWRKETDPYSIVVSEIMLQQTQVVRVIEYFDDWMKIFPDWNTLSQALLRDVLLQWQGLGYNRRGKYLHDISKIVIDIYEGVFPDEKSDLRSLPGIGPYTQAAIEAFSFNKPSILIETNIRTAVIYHFFKNHSGVTDTEIESILNRCYKPSTKAYKNPRQWNWALMDYGNHLKGEIGNLNKMSKTYAKQSRFEGSRRQLRSQVLKHVLEKKEINSQKIISRFPNKRPEEINDLLGELVKEGMIQRKNNLWKVI